MRPIFNVPGTGALCYGHGIGIWLSYRCSTDRKIAKAKLISQVEAERLLSFSILPIPYLCAVQ